MKRVKFLVSALLAVFCASTAMCQTGASAYFLEGSFDRYRLNPAFSPERAFLAIPVLGGNGLNARMNVGLADFLFESESHPGKLTTFMSSDISADRFLDGLPDRSALGFEYGTDVLSFGFGKEKWYAWFDSRLVVRTGMSIPKEMFSFMKAGLSRGEYEINDINVNASSYLETALGFQYEPVRHLRIGAAFKPLLGLAYADACIDRLYASTAGASWKVMADATVRNGVPMTEVVLEEGKISDVRTDGKFRLGPPNGFAIDLGVEYDFEGIKVIKLERNNVYSKETMKLRMAPSTSAELGRFSYEIDEYSWIKNEYNVCADKDYSVPYLLAGKICSVSLRTVAEEEIDGIKAPWYRIGIWGGPEDRGHYFWIWGGYLEKWPEPGNEKVADDLFIKEALRLNVVKRN